MVFLVTLNDRNDNQDRARSRCTQWALCMAKRVRRCESGVRPRRSQRNLTRTSPAHAQAVAQTRYGHDEADCFAIVHAFLLLLRVMTNVITRVNDSLFVNADVHRLSKVTSSL